MFPRVAKQAVPAVRQLATAATAHPPQPVKDCKLSFFGGVLATLAVGKLVHAIQTGSHHEMHGHPEHSVDFSPRQP